MGIQLIIGFLDLFKGFLGKNLEAEASARAEIEASARAEMQFKKLEQKAVPHVASL